MKIIVKFVAVMVAFIHSSCIQPYDKPLIFTNEEQTIILKGSEYKLKQRGLGFDVYISEKILDIKGISNPRIEFWIDGKKRIAKGVPIESSIVPKGEDFFYSSTPNSTIGFSDINKFRIIDIRKTSVE